ncbi:hypothetical protein R1sor_023087 [Riccia sorocarpa]|uniref:Translin n=1 Tax=Riccia sorocarpa TaxID=122646 RepID=A0ABD3GNG6_9MARC
MEMQFEAFRSQLEESGAVRERIRAVISELDNVVRVMQASLLPVHHATTQQAAKEVLNKAKSYIPQLQKLYSQLAEIIRDRPGQYYRYHDHWRNQTHTVVFLLSFVHWLDTQLLLSHSEVETLLGVKPEEFSIDIEDYLIGLCNISSELPRYVVNRVTAGDYECPRQVSAFLSDLFSAFRILNLRNDLLRKRFDGLKYDLKKVEEVLYDVKIRGLLSNQAAPKPMES